MKLPNVLQSFLQKKPDTKQELFASLLLDSASVTAATWVIDEKKHLQVVDTVTEHVTKDSWDQRLIASDAAIAKIEGDGPRIEKVVLGLPYQYLTEQGDIDIQQKRHVKILLKSLELTALGYVSLHQALVHTIKKEEGIPPNVILVTVGTSTLTVFLYKIGALIGVRDVRISQDISIHLEELLKSFTDVEVLPSRILLFSGDAMKREEVKRDLLRYPWQNRANFLHFPKIETVPGEMMALAVSLAGASELALTMGEDEDEIVVETESGQKIEESAPVAVTPVSEREHLHAHQNDPEEISEDSNDGSTEESNVMVVDPETVGFRPPEKIPRSPQFLRETESASVEDEVFEEEDDAEEKAPAARRFSFPKISLPSLKRIPGVGILIVIGILLLSIGAASVWALPRATVTVLVKPKTATETVSGFIDPKLPLPDTEAKSIPGKTQEQSVSTETSVPVTGKKKVGENAKGSVTIVNKSTTARVFKKGTVLTSGSLKFTLDADVSVASATATFDGVDYSKATGAVTASAIGTASNLAAGTEFGIADMSSSVAVARNDAAFAGGTSRDVTVVSRADMDALVAAATTELVEQAKEQLQGTVSENEKLLEETIKTTVTEKIFTEELDQEAEVLHGKITITVSGISYNQSDVVTLVAPAMHEKVPESSYEYSDSDITPTITIGKTSKDGRIAYTATAELTAISKLDTAQIQKDVTGKKVDEVQAYLQAIEGVGGVTFDIKLSPFADRLPYISSNIRITTQVAE